MAPVIEPFHEEVPGTLLYRQPVSGMGFDHLRPVAEKSSFPTPEGRSTALIEGVSLQIFARWGPGGGVAGCICSAVL